MNNNNGNTQVNSIRDQFNSRVEKRVMASKTKRVQWSNRRRFTSI
jgi:hypothetical protein